MPFRSVRSRVHIPTAVIVFLAAFPALGASAVAVQCVIDYAGHGTFHLASVEGSDCWQFTWDTGEAFEVLNHKTPWDDGMTGTLYGEAATVGTICQVGVPVVACTFDADYSRHVAGQLVFLNFIECPGYMIQNGGTTYKILNCNDFGVGLCSTENIGKNVQADVVVNTTINNCLGLTLSTVVDYRLVH
jgi:hypothetical protein